MEVRNVSAQKGLMPGFHNRFGLMGGNDHELKVGGTLSRSEVLPYSVMHYDEEEGWQQCGVYGDFHEAVGIAADWEEQGDHRRRAAVVDTEMLLDWCEANDGPLWSNTLRPMWLKAAGL